MNEPLQLVGTYTQASQVCGRSTWTLKRWAKDGKLKIVKVCGKNLVDFSSLRELLGNSEKGAA
jgi:hypothetical protein